MIYLNILDFFFLNVYLLQEKGWKKNGAIFDVNPEYRYPLIHWAAILSKYFKMFLLKYSSDQRLTCYLFRCFSGLYNVNLKCLNFIFILKFALHS